MRLWSLHPKYLDAKGIVALWREALLAQKVLQGETKGYRNHPQLNRFKETDNPVGAIADYLRAVAADADRRKYNFNKSKIAPDSLGASLTVTNGQLQYEVTHLKNKLQTRDPQLYEKMVQEASIEPHPLFNIVDGEVAAWEIV